MYNVFQPYQGYVPPRPENNLIRVTGYDGAKAYQMPPNSTVALFDGGEDIMYIKSTDGAGFPTIRVFRFEPVENQQSAATTPVDYVSRSEFEGLREEIDNVKQSIQQLGKPSKSADNKK